VAFAHLRTQTASFGLESAVSLVAAVTPSAAVSRDKKG
jgi:hypothetical protein